VKPYYEHDGITIFHGDCREVLLSIAATGVLITDPPYGMDYTSGTGGRAGHRRGERWEPVTGDDAPFDPSHLLGFETSILWGANWYANKLPPSGGWLVWDKTPKGSKLGFAASHAELAWTNLCGSIRKFSLQWGGEARNGEPFYHPTQKPVALAAWMLREFRPEAVIDPYMGAGWIAEACRDARVPYVGIEIEERYCEVAANRMAQEVMFA